MLNYVSRTKTIAIVTLFGVVIFVSKSVIPNPLDKMFVIIQALFLALGSLLLGRMGATYTATIGGLHDNMEGRVHSIQHFLRSNIWVVGR